jgi:hypothetical protein
MLSRRHSYADGGPQHSLLPPFLSTPMATHGVALKFFFLHAPPPSPPPRINIALITAVQPKQCPSCDLREKGELGREGEP